MIGYFFFIEQGCDKSERRLNVTKALLGDATKQGAATEAVAFDFVSISLLKNDLHWF